MQVHLPRSAFAESNLLTRSELQQVGESGACKLYKSLNSVVLVLGKITGAWITCSAPNFLICLIKKEDRLGSAKVELLLNWTNRITGQCNNEFRFVPLAAFVHNTCGLSLASSKPTNDERDSATRHGCKRERKKLRHRFALSLRVLKAN